MKYILTSISVIFINSGYGQSIQLEKVKDHIGDTVAVCGKVYGTKIITNENRDTLTLINLGAAYPNQLLTVVIKPTSRKSFPYKPEEYWKDKDLCVTGLVEQYKDKVQIEAKKETDVF